MQPFPVARLERAVANVASWTAGPDRDGEIKRISDEISRICLYMSCNPEYTADFSLIEKTIKKLKGERTPPSPLPA